MQVVVDRGGAVGLPAAYAEYKMRELGSEMTPFVTNIASGVNASIFERISTEKVIGENEMVIIDLGSVTGAIPAT